MRARSLRRFGLLGGLLLGLPLLGCGGNTEPGLALSIQVRNPLGAENPFADSRAAFVALIAEGPGIGVDKVQTVKPFNKLGTTAEVTMPFGAQRQVRVEVWTRDEATGQPFSRLARGRTMPLDVAEGSGVQQASAYVSFINQFARPVSDEGMAAEIEPRAAGTASELPNGEIIIAGGAVPKVGATNPYDPESYDSFRDSLVLYSPGKRQTISLSDALGAHLTEARGFHCAAAGRDGTVVFAGGYVNSAEGKKATRTVEFLDKSGQVRVAPAINPGNGSPQEPNLKFARAHCTMLRMFDDSDYFIVLGGKGDAQATYTWEIWHPQSGNVAQGELDRPRWNHGAVRLADPNGGYVVLVGGEDANGPIANFEVIRYDKAGHVAYKDYKELKAGCDPGTRSDCWIPKPEWNPIIQPFPDGAGKTLPGAAFHGGDGYAFIYVIGGFLDAKKQKPTDRFDAFDLVRGSWVTTSFKPPLPAVGAAPAQPGSWQGDATGFKLGQARGAPMTAVVTKGQFAGQILVAGGSKADGSAADNGEVIYLQNPEIFKEDKTLSGQPRLLSLAPLPVENALPDGGRVLGSVLMLSTGHVLLAGGVGTAPEGLVGRSALVLWNPL